MLERSYKANIGSITYSDSLRALIFCETRKGTSHIATIPVIYLL